MTMIGAAYLRCSDPRQDKSVQQQKEEIERRAAADGVVIPASNWFVDEGISGRTAKKRAAYQSLLRAAEGQRDSRLGRRAVRMQGIDRLYVLAFSRVARNMFDCLKALATLDEADIDVISLTEPDAGDKSFRKLIRPILAWLAERYSEELSRNVVRGMRSQAEKGFWQNGHAPYGYALQKVEGGTKLAVTDDTRADFETVQRIFAEYLIGKDGQKRLAERLTREGVRPPSREVARDRFAGTWRPKHVQNILTNVTYCGHLVQKGDALARNCHDAAVTDEDFARVAALRKLKDRNKDEGGNGNHAIHMSERGVLTPWLRCGSCGGRIAITGGGHTGNVRHYYTCATRQENKANCSGLSVRVEKLDAAVLDYIHDEALSPESVREMIDQGVVALADQPDEVQAERARLASDIAELDARIRKIGLQVADDIITGDDAKAINAPLIARRESLKLRLANLPERKAVPTPDRRDPAKFRAAVLEAWSTRPLNERREALDRLVEKITLSDGGAHVDYRVKDEQIAFHQPDPSGPPDVSWGQDELRPPRLDWASSAMAYSYITRSDAPRASAEAPARAGGRGPQRCSPAVRPPQCAPERGPSQPPARAPLCYARPMQRVLTFGATSAAAAEVAVLHARRGDRLHLVGRDPGKLARLAAGIVSAMDARADEVYVPGFWRLVMPVVRSMPEARSGSPAHPAFDIVYRTIESFDFAEDRARPTLQRQPTHLG